MAQRVSTQYRIGNKEILTHNRYFFTSNIWSRLSLLFPKFLIELISFQSNQSRIISASWEKFSHFVKGHFHLKSYPFLLGFEDFMTLFRSFYPHDHGQELFVKRDHRLTTPFLNALLPSSSLVLFLLYPFPLNPLFQTVQLNSGFFFFCPIPSHCKFLS